MFILIENEFEMSYQFEDESALEELLNQQLDRRKHPPSASSGSAARGASTRSASIQRSSLSQSNVERPSTATTALNKQSTFDESPDAAIKTTEPAKGRLASWLEAKSIDNGRSEPMNEAVGPPKMRLDQVRGSLNIMREPPVSLADQNNFMEERLTDEYLQEMSKQRLIQMILEQIVPSIKRIRQSINEESAIQVEKIKSELELERDKSKLLEIEHRKQVKLIESHWIELNKRLESQVESTTRDLDETIERHKSSINDLEAKHKEQITRLVESYENRLAEEKQQFEESQKRQDEFHRLELESKLKVNWDQVKLETIFQQWQKMIQSTIGELELQFKSVESLLDKQTIEINGSNTKLAERCKQVAEQYDKFELKGQQMNRLVGELSEILPRFSRIQIENEQLTKQSTKQLQELSTRNDDLRNKEAELDRLRRQLIDEREGLNKERFQLGLDTNKLVYKEERLDELLKGSRETETRLTEQAGRLASRESELEVKSSNLDMRHGQLRLQNYELHLMRKRLVAKEEELNKLGNELEAKKDLIGNQLIQVRSETEVLMKTRERAQKELSQLRRLQKSLICSLCLDRLFASSSNLNRSNKLKLSAAPTYDNLPETMDKQAVVEADSYTLNDLTIRNEAAAGNEPFSKLNVTGKGAGQGAQDSKAKFEEELADISRQIKRDERQLEAENKYLELLSVS